MVDHPNGFDHRWVAEKGKRTDPLTRFERKQVGRSKQIDVPLADDLTVRFAGELLEALGRDLQRISREDRPLKSRLFDAAWAVAGVRLQISERVGTIAGCKPTYVLDQDNREEPYEGFNERQPEEQMAD